MEGCSAAKLDVTRTSGRSGRSEQQMDYINIKRKQREGWTSTVIDTSLISGWGRRLDGGIELQRVEQVHRWTANQSS